MGLVTQDGQTYGAPVTFGVDGLQALFDTLVGLGYTLVGPTLREGAVVAAPISSVDDLPRGVTEEQQPGHYRLVPGDGEFLFGYAATALSWKPFLFPPSRLLWRSDGAVPQPPPRQALVGLRACDLAAIDVQDRVLTGRPYVDSDYAARREAIFVVTVTCAHPGGTCFCASMGTGPRARSGFDLALTEVTDERGHRFVAEAGTDAGAAVLAGLRATPAEGPDLTAAERVAADAAERMGRTVDTTDLRDLLYVNADHPRWDEVASRCLSCTSCTLVCPTCFCVTAQDTTDLAGVARRDRVWDSCFSTGHSHLHGGGGRSTTHSRYRQWLTHKFASWQDQFGTSGCVGCGRCITWCPAGIDVTEELAAIRATEGTTS